MERNDRMQMEATGSGIIRNSGRKIFIKRKTEMGFFPPAFKVNGNTSVQQ